MYTQVHYPAVYDAELCRPVDAVCQLKGHECSLEIKSAHTVANTGNEDRYHALATHNTHIFNSEPPLVTAETEDWAGPRRASKTFCQFGEVCDVKGVKMLDDFPEPEVVAL